MTTITVGELMDFLRDYPEDMAVMSFAEGRVYPALSVDMVPKDDNIPFDSIEIGCGWVPCNMYDDDEWEE
jgi:hypothetical protein